MAETSGDSTIRFVDLFCGCGGTSSGFKSAGWTPVAAIDWEPTAVRTYESNFPHCDVMCADVTDQDVQSKLVERWANKVDVVFGSPPCQGFSSRNTHTNHGKYDAMNRLPFVFVELAVRLNPNAIIMEEVPRAAVLVPCLSEMFKHAGYDVVTHAVVDAAHHGVAQHRRRLVIVACKSAHVSHAPLVTQQPQTAGEALRRAPVPARGRIVTEQIRSKILEWNEKGRRAGQYAVMDLERPSRTVHTQSLSSTGPYTIKRDGTYYEMSVEEAARLQSFPQNFVFCGATTSVRKQIGNAVPPALAECIAESLTFV